MPLYEAGFGSGRFFSPPEASSLPEPPSLALPPSLELPLGDFDSSSPDPFGSSDPMTARTTIAPTTDAVTISPVRFGLGCCGGT